MLRWPKVYFAGAVWFIRLRRTAFEASLIWAARGGYFGSYQGVSEAMSFEMIKIDQVDRVAIVTLNRPEVLNALNLQLVRANNWAYASRNRPHCIFNDQLVQRFHGGALRVIDPAALETAPFVAVLC